LMWQFMEQSSFNLTWWRFNYHTSTINSTTPRLFTYLVSKINDVLDNKLFDSYIKRLAIGLFTNR
jgi:hypothetical protein